MAHTIEFWKSEDKVMVEYNLKTMELGEFMHLSDTAKILDMIYNKIILEFPKEVDFKQSKLEIVAFFIKRHFMEKDKAFDVLVLGNGNIVKFNSEKGD